MRTSPGLEHRPLQRSSSGGAQGSILQNSISAENFSDHSQISNKFTPKNNSYKFI
jgi:hypothetical protein